MTTIKTVTDAQIESLRNEAGNAGDREIYEICVRALDGSARARKLAVKAIQSAEAAAS